MRFSGLFSLSTAALLLAGCVTSTPQGAEAHLESFLEDAVTAEFIAEECSSIRMGYSAETLTSAYIDQMIAAGYEITDIALGYITSSSDEVLLRVIARLMASGIDPYEPASICALGRAEMAAGTRTGSFLR